MTENKSLGKNFCLIDENYQCLPNYEKNIESYFWVFDVDEKDYFLTKKSSWYSFSTNVYNVLIDRYEIMLPEGFYILIGDIDGRLDWILVDEIISRPFEAFIIPGTLDTNTWQILPLEIVGYEENYHYYYPYMKNPITPIYVGMNKAILVSNRNMYPKTKDFDFPDYI